VSVLSTFSVATYHPNFILRQNARLSGLFEHALGRAVALSKGEGKPQWKEDEFILKPTADMVVKVLRSMAGGAVAFDVETDGGHPLENQLRVVGFYDGKVGICVPLLYRTGEREDVPVKDPKTGTVTIENREVWARSYKGAAEIKVLKAMKALLEGHSPHRARVRYTQNGQYDRMVLRARLGYDIPAGDDGQTFDTLVAHHVLAPFLPHDLGLLATLYTDAPFYKKTSSGGWAASTDHDLALYNLRDVKATWLVAEKMLQELQAEYPAANSVYLHDMWQEQECERWKRIGFQVDRDTLEFFRFSYTRKRDRAMKAMKEILADVGVGSENENFKALLDKLMEAGDADADDPEAEAVALFNPASLNQLRMMLRGLKIPLDEVTATGELSTAKEILTGARKELLNKGVKGNDPRIAFLDYLFAWREAAKVVGTYLFPEILSDGRVHPSFSVHTVPSGRLTSQRPNFQNQPADIRGMFVAREDHVIISQDWDALEMRLGAFLSGDPAYVAVFKAYDAKTGPKPHHANMAAIFGLPATKQAAEQNPGMYRAAKVFAYAVAYGAGEDTVFEQVREELPDLTWDAFLVAYESYKKAYPVLFEFQQQVVKLGTKRGWLETALNGRRAYFFEKGWGTSPEATAMQNLPYQGAGADIVSQANKRVMRKLVEPIRRGEYPTMRLLPGEVLEQLAQVHDELVFECPLRFADEFMAECKRISEEKPIDRNGVVLDWNLPVDAHHARRWMQVQTRCECRELIDIELVEPRLWEGTCPKCKKVKTIEVV
jgi:DNA polymerase I-like protein with 3'-5' exonuclease and polymerase domains